MRGGKYAVEFAASIALAIVATVLFVVTLPASGFFAICGAIGAGIAAVNAITNVATSWKASNSSRNGDPTWALIYGKQDKLSDVLRQTNFNNGIANRLSNQGADAIDATETFCDIVGVAEIGKSVGKLFGNKKFNLFKNTDGSSKLGDFKNSIKKTFENFKVKGKSNITGYADNIEDVAVNKLDDVVTKGGSQAVTKPNQVHHYATDKSKSYTNRFEDITKKYDLELNGEWNKELLPHQGRHPNAYHDFVIDEMRNIDNIANGNKDIFLDLYETEIKRIIRDNPDMLYSDYWKNLK